MRFTLWIIMISICLTGCSEMRVIGNAAMREFRADAVAVNWSKDRQGAINSDKLALIAPAKERSFSSYRGARMAKKAPIKGLWEKRRS